MNVTETIRTFLAFFGDRGHQMVPGSSLVAPNGDPVLRRLLRRALTVLWRPDSTTTLEDLPTSLVEQTLTQFGQYGDNGPVRDVLRGEERRFVGLLTRGRKVLAQLGPGRPLTEADLRYLHQTHGLPPELVTELLD